MDFLLNLIDGNEAVNYMSVVICVVIYVVLLWLAVSLWAGRDAARRYNSSMVGAAWFILIFILNFPALMFYLVVRPDDHHFGSLHSAGGGVNMPLVNFVGKEGEMVFGLELRINPQELTETSRDMRVSIDWESKDSKKVVSTESLVVEAEASQRKLDNVISRLRANVHAEKLLEIRKKLFSSRSKNLAAAPLEPAPAPSGLDEAPLAPSEAVEAAETLETLKAEVQKTDDTGYNEETEASKNASKEI